MKDRSLFCLLQTTLWSVGVGTIGIEPGDMEVCSGEKSDDSQKNQNANYVSVLRGGRQVYTNDAGRHVREV